MSAGQDLQSNKGAAPSILGKRTEPTTEIDKLEDMQRKIQKLEAELNNKDKLVKEL